MAAIAIFFGLTGIFGAISGGLNASKQQAQIKNEVCQLGSQMHQLQTLSANKAELMDLENSTLRQQLSQLSLEISDRQQLIREQHQKFKKTYTLISTGAIIFLILLAFMFATKRIILHSHTE